MSEDALREMHETAIQNSITADKWKREAERLQNLLAEKDRRIAELEAGKAEKMRIPKRVIEEAYFLGRKNENLYLPDFASRYNVEIEE